MSDFISDERDLFLSDLVNFTRDDLLVMPSEMKVLRLSEELEVDLRSLSSISPVLGFDRNCGRATLGWKVARKLGLHVKCSRGSGTVMSGDRMT